MCKAGNDYEPQMGVGPAFKVAYCLGMQGKGRWQEKNRTTSYSFSS